MTGTTEQNENVLNARHHEETASPAGGKIVALPTCQGERLLRPLYKSALPLTCLEHQICRHRRSHGVAAARDRHCCRIPLRIGDARAEYRPSSHRVTQQTNPRGIHLWLAHQHAVSAVEVLLQGVPTLVQATRIGCVAAEVPQ